MNEGLAAMNKGNWEQALALNSEAVERFGKNPEAAMDIHGPQFGVIWFRKGISELKLNKSEEAAKSFEACYKDFPNKEDSNSKNPFNKQALLKWGEAEMAAKNYDEAIKLWKKFLSERAPSDSYPRGPFHVNMAIAHYKLGKIPEGNEHLEIAITNKTAFRTPDAAIISAFQSLVEAAISKEDEQVITDFLRKNQGALVGQPFEMQRFSGVFMKLAADAIKAEMFRTALSLYNLVPSTQVVIDDLRATIGEMGGSQRIAAGGTPLEKKKLQAELKKVEEQLRSGKANETIFLAATAFLHETMGNPHGAYVAYLQLENHYKKAERREDNLYNLFRTASIIGKDEESLKYGQIMRQEFPDTKYMEDVEKLVLSQLFFAREYEEAIALATEILDSGRVAQGTPAHDFALFVKAGSYFYQGAYEEAAPLLDAHIEAYPGSDFAMQTQYFQASNATRLRLWSKAASLLDAFLKAHSDGPDQSYIPLALLDRANAHYSEDQAEGALEKTDLLISKYPDSSLVDQAYILRGNVFETESDLEAAETSYKKALETAESRGNASSAGEALNYLIALLGQDDPEEEASQAHIDAVAFADKYWGKYSEGSPYRAEVAVAQLNAFYAVGRSEEALTYLQKVIASIAKLKRSSGLEGAINAYTEAYLLDHTPAELEEHYNKFPGISSQDSAARALLRIAVIGVYQDVLAETADREAKRTVSAKIQALFQRLKTDFELADLTNLILVDLGDYLRKNTAAPREALPYYNEVLGRKDAFQQFRALLGRADIYGRSKIPEDLNSALKDFERIFTESTEKQERELALFRIIEILMEKGEYEQAAVRANQYLDRDPEKNLFFNSYTAEVGLMLANSFKERKMTDDAISMYVKIWGANMGYIKVSAPAMRDWMTLSYERNRKSDDPKVVSDRQGAYNGGWRYIDLTRSMTEKFTDEELELWKEVEKLVEKYVADPNVKSMEQLEAEKKAARN